MAKGIGSRTLEALVLGSLVVRLAPPPIEAAQRPEPPCPNVRLSNSAHRWAVAKAYSNAARQLAEPACQALLDDFADASGRSLRAALRDSGKGAPEYLESLFFYDAPTALCGTSALAVTTPGSRAILVCGARFVRQMSRNSRHAEATIIHEALHSLGLGENPPSSDYINAQVIARCGRR